MRIVHVPKQPPHFSKLTILCTIICIRLQCLHACCTLFRAQNQILIGAIRKTQTDIICRSTLFMASLSYKILSRGQWTIGSSRLGTTFEEISYLNSGDSLDTTSGLPAPSGTFYLVLRYKLFLRRMSAATSSVDNEYRCR